MKKIVIKLFLISIIPNFVYIVTATQAETLTNQCNIEALIKNLDVNAEVRPSIEGNLVIESDEQEKFLSHGRLIPCTMADLLKLGFEHRSRTRYGPTNSTNGAFEEISILQKNELVVSCYLEFDLTERSKAAKVVWSRSACGQTVQPRLLQK